jgi:RNA polymerase sigma factor (sigma-70 family)
MRKRLGRVYALEGTTLDNEWLGMSMATRFVQSVLHCIRAITVSEAARNSPDRELLERFRTVHDETAFAALLKRHGPLVLAECRRILEHDQDAEDAFQATFLVLAKSAASIRKPQALASWLHGVAYRIATKARVGAARRRVKERQVAVMAAVETERDYTSSELRQILDEEIHRLPERYRVPLILCHLQGKTNGQAAQQLGCAEGTILSRLSRARQRLRTRLLRRGLALTPGALTAALAETANAAAVPAVLLESTSRAALLFSVGQLGAAGVASGVASARAVVLANSLLHSMSLAKFALAVAGVALIVLLSLAFAASTDFHAPARPDAGNNIAAPLEKPVLLVPPQPHTGDIYRIAFSRDGKLLATASQDKTVNLWDGSGSLLATLRGHDNEVNWLSFSPDGRTLATSSDDGSIRLWDVPTRRERQTVSEQMGHVVAVVFAPDGKTLVSGGDDGLVRHWNLAEKKQIRVFKGHTGRISSLAFSHDGHSVASGSHDRTVRLWDVDTGSLRFELVGHTDEVRAVALCNSARPLLASSAADRTIRLWNTATGAALTTLEGHTDSVEAVDFSRSGETLASGARDGTIRLWQVADGKELARLNIAMHRLWSVAFSPDERWIVAAGENRRLRWWQNPAHTPGSPAPMEKR